MCLLVRNTVFAAQLLGVCSASLCWFVVMPALPGESPAHDELVV